MPEVSGLRGPVGNIDALKRLILDKSGGQCADGKGTFQVCDGHP